MVSDFININLDATIGKLNVLAQKLCLNNTVEFVYTNGVVLENEYFNLLAQKAKEIAPFGKVVIFCTQKNYSTFADKVYRSLKKQAMRPTIFVAQEKQGVVINDVAGYFSLAEDIRLAIVCDEILFDKATYFCTLKNIPLVECIRSYDCYLSLLNKIYVDTGKFIDEYLVNCKRYILFDYQSILVSDKLKAITLIGGKVCVYLDYKINRIILGLLENSLINSVFQTVIENTVMLINGDYDDCATFNALIYGMFALELLNMADGGVINDCSCARQVSRLLNGGLLFDDMSEYFAVKKTLEKIACDTDKDNFEYSVDYVTLSLDVAKKLKLDERRVVKNILSTAKTMRECVGFNKLFLAVKPIAKTLCEQFVVIDKYFRKLGGNKLYHDKSIEKNLWISGYSAGINYVSLLCENGKLKI